MTESAPLRSYVQWPDALRAYLERTHGPPVGIDRLGGMSSGSVHRLHFSTGSVIVKRSESATERSFYEQIAPMLRQRGVPTPRCEWSGNHGSVGWLVLEDIPNPLPPERWRGDPEVADVLVRLHSATLHRPLTIPGGYRPSWPDEMTQLVLSCFPDAVARHLDLRLRILQDGSHHLFRPVCSISGDPNPTNWGIRANGVIVLYDWERFGLGTPALDLAITVPGLGEPADFATVAEQYLQAWQQRAGPSPWSLEQLTRDLPLAKAWSVVEFLSQHAEGRVAVGQTTIDYLITRFPRWLAQLDLEPMPRR